MSATKNFERWASSIFLLFFFVAGMCSIPWDDLAGGLVDREVYKNYFLFEESVLEYRDFNSALDYVTNEYLWHFLVSFSIESLGIDIESVFFSISALCVFSFGLLVIKNKQIFPLVFLVNPLVVDLAFSQFRSAFAISLIYLGYLSGKRAVVLVVGALCVFIHTASLLFVVIFYLSYVVSNHLRSGGSLYFYTIPMLFFIGFFIALLLGPLREGVLSAVGDRRAEYGDMSSSLMYMVFWLILGYFCLKQKKEWFSIPENSFAFIILSLAASNLLFSGYSLRFIGASMPFLVSGMLRFNNPYRQLAILLYVPYVLVQWAYWIRSGYLIL